MIALLFRLVAIVASLWPFVTKAMPWIAKALNSRWTWLVAWAGISYVAVSHSQEAAQWLLDKAGFHMPDINTAEPTGLAYSLSVANTFMPMTELFALLTTYGTFMVALNGYKTAKASAELVDKIKPK